MKKTFVVALSLISLCSLSSFAAGKNGAKTSSSANGSTSSTDKGDSFQGEVNINGKKQKFRNQAEFNAAMKKLVGNSNGKFPPGFLKNLLAGQNGAKASSSTSGNSSGKGGSFEGEININGQKQKFNNQAEYDAAKKKLLGNVKGKFPPGFLKNFANGQNGAKSSSSTSGGTSGKGGSFAGEININGKKQKFRNQAEFNALMKKMFGNAKGKFPPGFLKNFPNGQSGTKTSTSTSGSTNTSGGGSGSTTTGGSGQGNGSTSGQKQTGKN